MTIVHSNLPETNRKGQIKICLKNIYLQSYVGLVLTFYFVSFISHLQCNKYKIYSFTLEIGLIHYRSTLF